MGTGLPKTGIWVGYGQQDTEQVPGDLVYDGMNFVHHSLYMDKMHCAVSQYFILGW